MSDQLRVAVVDDTPDMRLLVRMSLELDADIHVVGEAEDGLGAIDLARRERPDVMLLDLAMPVMDGMQALPRVREVSPVTSVLVLSGFSGSAMAADAMAAGAAGYLQKGIAGKDLCREVWLASGRERPPSPAEAEVEPVEPDEPQETAEEEVQRLRTALARIAHELRTPVSVIVGLAELTQAGEQLDGDRRELVRTALLRQSAILERITSDLETAAHAQHDALAVQLGRVDVTAVVQDCVRTAGLVDSVEVRADADAWATADASRLTQIVTNLLSNARKYADPPYEVHVVRHDGEVHLTVADRGPGVPEEFRPLLFREFTRAHQDARGTGLGLSVVRTLVQAQAGSVEHQPRPGGGSLFVVRLPAG